MRVAWKARLWWVYRLSKNLWSAAKRVENGRKWRVGITDPLIPETYVHIHSDDTLPNLPFDTPGSSKSQIGNERTLWGDKS
ncbi:hypothetical protein FA13DRAFT_1112197 [Coprinellus micaceus]|uniref:Uncharacterized protein n=1 Tax=Coprinellus micaceus TaxID=71717 RepID=A0A4Y7SW86_COPMI|nr:hypothetical protein FA13DRAFT_1112197 [Coprinellus micaceus]